MWGKSIDRDGSRLAAPRATSTNLDEGRLQGQTRAPGIGSVGKTMQLLGEIHSSEELYFDGEIEGTLEVSDRLTIGPNGRVKANVRARDLVVQGCIQGNVEAVDRVVIMNGASIVGDVRTAGIVIDDGAFFKGGIDITRTEIRPESASSTPAIAAKSQGAGT